MKTTKKKFLVALFAFCVVAALPSLGASFWLGTGEDSSVAANWDKNKALLNGDNFYIRDGNMTGTAYRRKMKLGANKTGYAGNCIFFEAGSEADPFIVDGNGKTLTMSYNKNTDTGNGKITVGAVGNFSGGVVLNGGTYKPTGIAVGKSSSYTGYLKLDNGAKIGTVTTNSVWAYNNWVAFGKLVIDGGSEVKFGDTATSGANLRIGGGDTAGVSGAHGECHVLNGTLVNRGHVVIGYFGESSDGTGYAYMEVDGGLVTNKTGNVDIGEDGTPGDRSILRIKSGTFAAAGPLRIGRGSSGTLFMDGGVLDVSRDSITMSSTAYSTSGEDCTLVMSNGVVKTQTLQYGSGAADATVLFDGGTLQAAQSGTLVKAHGNMTVSVGPRGGTIDANGKTVAIEEELSGAGGMTFKGGGSVTLASGNAYTGTTTVEIGTTVHVAAASEIWSGLAVTVPAETPADGIYTLLAIDGEDVFTDAVLSGVDTPANATLRLSADKKSVLCVYGNPQNTWIGGDSGSLNDYANWSLGFVPGVGDSCVIGNATAAALTNPEESTFAPASITFPADSAAVTISGDAAITGIAAITNHSALAHVFNCAVSGGAMDFYNDTMRCEFRGGITLATATFGGASSNDARGLVGDWHFTGGWTPVSYNCIGVGDASGSSVTVAGELFNPNSMSIMSGSVVTAATMRVTTSAYFAYANEGALVVTGELRTENSGADPYFMRNGTTQNATVEFGSFVNQTSGKWAVVNAPNVIVGAGGMDITGSSVLFAGTPSLVPGAECYAINSTSSATYRFDSCTLTLNTTMRGTARPATIAVNGCFVDRDASKTGAINVTGNGKVVFNSASTFSNGLSVGDTATVAVNAGCTPGSGAVSVASGATLQAAQSGMVTLGGNLTLADGATLAFNFTERRSAPVLNLTDRAVALGTGKSVKVSISGTHPAAGANCKYDLTSGGQFTKDTNIDWRDYCPNWVKSVAVNDEGNICVEVIPVGLTLIIN